MRGLRIITLDSAVPGYHHGGFSDDQYAWLARPNSRRRPSTARILVIHHAPITYRSPLMQLLDFDDVDRLRDGSAGTDVRAVLSGHLHVTSFGTIGAVPVIVAGGVSYVDDVGAPRDAADGRRRTPVVEPRRGARDGVVATVVPVGPARDLAGHQ